MIKIVSGISFPGGATIAQIHLCNLFNENGHPCVYYGPHEWHRNKCRSGALQEFSFADTDIVIVHNLDLAKIGSRPQVRKIVLSCHETDGYPLRTMDLRPVDLVHFVSASQRDWHQVDYPSVVIPNVVSPLTPSKRQADGQRIAGIVGNIDPHKQTHLSILRAAEAGCDKIVLFGNIMDKEYFAQTIQPLGERFNGKVILMGFVENAQAIYDSVDVIYHSSKRETFNYIKAECRLTGTLYEGLDSADTDAELLSAPEILARWASCLEL